MIRRSDAQELDTFVNIGRKPGFLQISRKPKYRWDLAPEAFRRESVYNRMRRAVIQSMFTSLDTVKQLKAKPYSYPDGTPNLVPMEPTLRHIRKNGRPLIEIHAGNEFPGKDNDTGWYLTIRADEVTRRVVELDTKVVRLSTKRVLGSSHSDGYIYDQPQPAGTFDLNVPPDSYLTIDENEITSPWDKIMHRHNVRPQHDASTHRAGPAAPR